MMGSGEGSSLTLTSTVLEGGSVLVGPFDGAGLVSLVAPSVILRPVLEEFSLSLSQNSFWILV